MTSETRFDKCGDVISEPINWGCMLWIPPFTPLAIYYYLRDRAADREMALREQAAYEFATKPRYGTVRERPGWASRREGSRIIVFRLLGGSHETPGNAARRPGPLGTGDEYELE